MATKTDSVSSSARTTPLHRRKLPDRRQIQRVLQETFGLEELRESQCEVIDSVLRGEDILAVMPTGAGKSLCYQLPGQLLEGTTIIVSPLIALMKDQRDKLDALDLGAFELNSALTEVDQKKSLASLKKGKAEYLYTTPERLADPDFLKVLKSAQIDMLVIDEAHCISQWGHDFRPAYLAIPDVWRSLGCPQLLALTATATPEVVEEIGHQFGLRDLKVIHSGVYRENLQYEAVLVEKEDEKLPLVIDAVRNLEGSGIIYSATVKGVEQIHKALVDAGLPAVKYHGRMKIKDRNEQQDLFMSNRAPLIVATNAFGMGIDKQDIRFVIHYHFAGSLEAYYQESGRAGRDGEEARCILLYLRKDKSTQSFFLAGRYPGPEAVAAVYQVLDAADAGGSKKMTESGVQKTLTTIAPSKVKVILAALRTNGIIDIRDRGAIHVLRKGLQAKDLEGVYAHYTAKKENDQKKLKQMIIYAQSSLCRWKILLNYFGQPADWNDCGQCDNCLKHASIQNLSVQTTKAPEREAVLMAEA